MKSYSKFLETKKNIESVITPDEIEDQFLRLKEIFNCDITISHAKYTDMYHVIITTESKSILQIIKISEEFLLIKNRIEKIYPIEMYWSLLNNPYEEFMTNLENMKKGNLNQETIYKWQNSQSRISWIFFLKEK